MADEQLREVIGGKRKCGKTTELIKRSHETGIRILTANNSMARLLTDESIRMGLKIKPPLTPDVQFNYFEDVDEVLVDEVEIVLQQLIGKRVSAMSTSYALRDMPSLDEYFERKHNASEEAFVDTIITLAKEYVDDNNPLSLKVTTDVSDALVGIKAIQREARKATAAIKEFEQAYNKVKSIAEQSGVNAQELFSLLAHPEMSD